MIGGENTSGRLRRRCSSMVEHQLPKLNTRVRFPSSPTKFPRGGGAFPLTKPPSCFHADAANTPRGGLQTQALIAITVRSTVASASTASSLLKGYEPPSARGPDLGILQFIDAVRLVVPRPQSVSIARTVRRVLSTSKPMVAGTSVRLPSISDSSATTNRWGWKLFLLGHRALISF